MKMLQTDTGLAQGELGWVRRVTLAFSLPRVTRVAALNDTGTTDRPVIVQRN